MKTSASLPSEIAGRGAIVTGGFGHLGRAISVALAARGAHVVALDIGASPIDHPGVVSNVCDLLDPAAVRRAINEAVEQVGAISILVNAAGMIHSQPLVDATAPAGALPDLDTFRRVLDSNLTTAWVATSLVARHMFETRTRGVVVSLSSVAAMGNAGQSAYAAAKAGINALTSVWAKELGLLGMRFVAVAPGFIDTPSTHDAMKESVLQDWLRRTPTRALGTKEDVVSAVMFAIENRHLTGTVLSVDGGLTV